MRSGSSLINGLARPTDSSSLRHNPNRSSGLDGPAAATTGASETGDGVAELGCGAAVTRPARERILEPHWRSVPAVFSIVSFTRGGSLTAVFGLAAGAGEAVAAAGAWAGVPVPVPPPD